ncbi:MAG: GNAT family N-acetyltransferase [Erysipelotrichaceae bacterium]|nr:GNAT family N-acetyltransferase [Erysipelotrichaceae bacterium]
MEINYVRTTGNDPTFNELCAELDAWLIEQRGKKLQMAKYDAYNHTDTINDVILAMADDFPIGCASYKYHADGVAELKRVFIKEAFRCRGIAKELVGLVENDAFFAGYHTMILETGKAFEGSNALYSSMGYEIIDNYGPYVGLDDSVCMKKELNF